MYSKNLLWIICALFLGKEAQGKIRGIPGVDYPNYSTIPSTSFKCSEQQYIPGFYADLETRCQVFHYCYKNRKESFLCAAGTIFNQPIQACDYWYSTECSLTPSFYGTNAVKKDSDEVNDLPISRVERDSNDMFEKMAALYDEKSGDSDMHLTKVQILDTQNQETMSNSAQNAGEHGGKLSKIPSNGLHSSEIVRINPIDLNYVAYKHDKENTEDIDTFYRDHQYEIWHNEPNLKPSGDDHNVDFARPGISERVWTKNEISYRTDFDEDYDSSGEISGMEFNLDGEMGQMTTVQPIDPQNKVLYEEELIFYNSLSKRLSETELSPKKKRLRRKLTYAVLQTEEMQVTSTPENVKEREIISSSEDTFNASTKYTEVPNTNTIESHKTDVDVVRFLPGRTKQNRKPLVMDNTNEIETLRSAIDKMKSSLPSNLFDAYYENVELISTPPRRKPILIENTIFDTVESATNLDIATTAPTDASKLHDTVTTFPNILETDNDVERVKTFPVKVDEAQKLNDFIFPNTMPQFDTIEDVNLNEYTDDKDDILDESPSDGSVHNSFPEEKDFSKDNPEGIETYIVRKFPNKMVEDESLQDNFEYRGTEIADNEHESKLNGSNEIEHTTILSSQDHIIHNSMQNEHIFDYSYENFNVEDKWIDPVVDNSVPEYGNTRVSILTNNFKYSASDTARTSHSKIPNYIYNSNNEWVSDGTLSPLMSTEASVDITLHEQQVLPAMNNYIPDQYIYLPDITTGTMNNERNLHFELNENNIHENNYEVEENKNYGTSEDIDIDFQITEMPRTSQEYYNNDASKVSRMNEDMVDSGYKILDENMVTNQKVVNILKDPYEDESMEVSLKDALTLPAGVDIREMPSYLRNRKALQDIYEVNSKSSVLQNSDSEMKTPAISEVYHPERERNPEISMNDIKDASEEKVHMHDGNEILENERSHLYDGSIDSLPVFLNKVYQSASSLEGESVDIVEEASSGDKVKLRDINYDRKITSDEIDHSPHLQTDNYLELHQGIGMNVRLPEYFTEKYETTHSIDNPEDLSKLLLSSSDDNELSMENVIHSDLEPNKNVESDISQLTFLKESNSLPKAVINKEISDISQTQSALIEQAIQVNKMRNPNTISVKGGQFNTEKPPFFVDGLKLQSSTRGNLLQTVDRTQFATFPAFRSAQSSGYEFFPTYLPDYSAHGVSLFSARTGKLLKPAKFSKLLSFGKKLLAMKRAKLNILRKYVASFNRKKLNN